LLLFIKDISNSVIFIFVSLHLDKTATSNFDPPRDRTVEEEEEDSIVVQQDPDLADNSESGHLDPDLASFPDLDLNHGHVDNTEGDGLQVG
jgi:hypothetical protein